jgi:Leucine-rich repeat (LRR) protein
VPDRSDASVEPAAPPSKKRASDNLSSERLKPYYARRIKPLIPCLGLLGMASWWFYLAFLGAAFDLRMNQAVASHAQGNLLTALILVSFPFLVFTTVFAPLWIAGIYLRDRGIILPEDVRGFVLGKKYPSHWCYTDDELKAKRLARSRWRRPQVSIRGLMAIVVCVAAGFAWLVNGSRSNRDAVAAIEQRGGKVGHDWCYSRYNRPIKQEQPRGFRWLESWDGFGFFKPARLVIVNTSGGSDSDLVHVGRLGQLEALDLSFSSVNDSGLVHLEGLDNLVVLHLRSTRISDKGLAHLAGLNGIELLGLANTSVTGAGLRHLRHLTKLTWLDLTKTKIGDDGLEYLAGLTALDTLGLTMTCVTDAGLGQVGKLQSLTWLHLAKTGVSDVGLEKLQGLIHLNVLELKDTSVTQSGIDRLQRTLPYLRIIH